MNQPQVYMYPPILNLFPSVLSLWVVPEHQLWVPASCICFTYGNVHVSMQFSQIIPPSLSPTESKSLLYICVSLLPCR